MFYGYKQKKIYCSNLNYNLPLRSQLGKSLQAPLWLNETTKIERGKKTLLSPNTLAENWLLTSDVVSVSECHVHFHNMLAQLPTSTMASHLWRRNFAEK